MSTCTAHAQLPMCALSVLAIDCVIAPMCWRVGNGLKGRLSTPPIAHLSVQLCSQPHAAAACPAPWPPQ